MKKYLFLIIVLFIPFSAGAQSPEPNVCDPNYKGEQISFTVTTQLTLEALVDQIHRRFGVNFLMGDGVKDLPIDIRSGSLPWKTMLDSQLYLSGVSTKCVNNNTLL